MSQQISTLVQSSVAHDGVSCDHCFQTPIRGVRYKCINCPDYDLCPACEELLQTQCFHSLTHTFLKIRTSIPNPYFPFIPFNPAPAITLPSLITVLNTFTFNLHASIGSGTLCGPNIFKALLMASAGASGHTLSAFTTALTLPPSAAPYLNTLESALFASTPMTEIITTASIWHSPFLTPLPSWTNMMKTDFNGSFGVLDPLRINEFIENNTKKRIKTSYSWQDLKPPLVLVSTFYFKAKWKVPFPLHASLRQNFRDFSGTPIRGGCKLMTRVDDIEYYEDSAVQACLLDYDEATTSSSTPRWTAAVILPRETGRDAMQRVLKGLNVHSWDEFRGRFGGEKTRVQLFLPSFELKTRVDLIVELSKGEMGLAAAFAEDADFSGVTADKGIQMNISGVDHWVWLKVDEQGTEVAAATVVGVLFSGQPRVVRTEVMRCDRPFLFVVFERVGGLVVAMSVVDNVGEVTYGGIF